jgi:DeoR family fructose operon transcriptional repressor
MRRIERGERIYEFLKEKGNASIVYLARMLNISESSVRRDVDYMAHLPMYRSVQRVHGGVFLNTNRSEVEYMFELKVDLHHELKRAIAKKALEYIENGDSILVDSGTTCLCLAELLGGRKKLRVITPDIKIAEELGKNAEIESCVIGGVIRPGYYTIGGSGAVENLEKFSGYNVFMSADSVDVRDGLTNTTEFEVGVKKKIIESGNRVFLLADQSKFTKRALYKIADLAQIHLTITNKGVDDEIVRRMTDLGHSVVLA